MFTVGEQVEPQFTELVETACMVSFFIQLFDKLGQYVHRSVKDNYNMLIVMCANQEIAQNLHGVGKNLTLHTNYHKVLYC